MAVAPGEYQGGYSGGQSDVPSDHDGGQFDNPPAPTDRSSGGGIGPPDRDRGGDRGGGSTTPPTQTPGQDNPPGGQSPHPDDKVPIPGTPDDVEKKIEDTIKKLLPPGKGSLGTTVQGGPAPISPVAVLLTVAGVGAVSWWAYVTYVAKGAVAGRAAAAK